MDLFKEELRAYKAVSSLLASAQAVPQLTMDILLDVSDLNANQALVLHKDHTRLRVEQPTHNIVLESWHLDLLAPTPASVAASSSLELPLVYKQGILLFRALVAATRALPAYKLSRQLHKGKQGLSSGLRIGCRLHQSTEGTAHQPGEYGLHDALAQGTDPVDSFDFSPVSTPSGNLSMHVQYRRHADFGVEDKEALLSSRFLNEDFFKPSIKPGSAPSSRPQSFERGGSLGSRYQPSPLSVGVSAQAARPGAEAGSSSNLPNDARGHVDPKRASLEDSSGDGAFVLSRTPSLNSTKGKAVPMPPSSRRLSTHLYRGASPSSNPHTGSGAVGNAGLGITASPQPIPASTASPALPSTSYRAQSFSSGLGPSSSLRYTALHRRSDSEESPQGEPSSLSSSRSVAVPRYSSHRYARSTSSTGSGDSAAQQQQQALSASPAFGPESLGRRSRMGSYFKEPKLTGTPEDSDDINSFLQLIDNRPQLRAASSGSQKSASALATEADERLRALAGSLAGLPLADVQEESQHPRNRSRRSSGSSSQRRTSDAPALPSSFPRYVQTQERRQQQGTKVQTGFFTQSFANSPHAQSSLPFPSLSRYSSSPAAPAPMSAAATTAPTSTAAASASASACETPPSPAFADDEGPVGRLEMSEERPLTRRASSEQTRTMEGVINIHRGGRSKAGSRDRGSEGSGSHSHSRHRGAIAGHALRRVGSNSSSSSSSAASNV